MKNWWFLKVSIVLQISPQRKLQSLWILRLIIHKIVKNHQNIFLKDVCKHARTRWVNVRARVLPRRNARAHVDTSCARVCAQIFTKIFLIILYYLMNVSLKFHKDRSFRCGDICKTILTFKNHQFSMYFAYFAHFCTSKVFKDG